MPAATDPIAPPAPASRRWRGPALLAAGAAGAITLWQANPYAPGSLLPPCVFHAMTGLYCPGCGATRALHALLHLDLPQALAMNPLLVLCLPVLALFALQFAGWLPARLAPLLRRVADARPWAVLILGYALARNLPWPPFSWLAPGV